MSLLIIMIPLCLADSLRVTGEATSTGTTSGTMTGGTIRIYGYNNGA
jgi:hypothetical protein